MLVPINWKCMPYNNDITNFVDFHSFVGWSPTSSDSSLFVTLVDLSDVLRIWQIPCRLAKWRLFTRYTKSHVSSSKRSRRQHCMCLSLPLMRVLWRVGGVYMVSALDTTAGDGGLESTSPTTIHKIFGHGVNSIAGAPVCQAINPSRTSVGWGLMFSVRLHGRRVARL
jgi:hypothetical protein